MAEWLKRAIEEVNKEYEKLPEWKKLGSERFIAASQEEDKRSSNIREPLLRESYR